ncbi:MAG: tetratricopeptide repeat protein [Terriglobales bacterium]
MIRHSSRPALLVLLLCLPLSRSVAQHQAGNVHVYVTYPDDRAVTVQVKVSLISGSSGTQVEENFTNDRGEATFLNVAVGNYHVSVSGEGIQATQSDSFEVDERKTTQSVLVRVQRAAEGAPANPTNASGATISASDLKVPKKASKEFDKATKLIARQDWQAAIDQLNKAIVLYPAYAEAYNNLGVAYAHLGNSDKEREALQKAVAVDNHFAPALVNLARLELKEHSFAAAETHLHQATAADPNDPRALVLLAQAQLLDHHYEDAIASAGKVQALSHDSYAVIHYVAARACERLNRLRDAVNELKLFLAEEPSGERADAARQEMAAIQKELTP